VVRFERIIHGRASGPVEVRPCVLKKNDDTVVLMDVQVPGLDGFDMALAFRSKGRIIRF
jgi:DNA-binding response OmpR family regulator